MSASKIRASSSKSLASFLEKSLADIPEPPEYNGLRERLMKIMPNREPTKIKVNPQSSRRMGAASKGK